MPRLSASEVVAAQKAHHHASAVRAMHRVAQSDDDLAASLRALAREVREAGCAKQEPSGVEAPKGSTAPRSSAMDGRAAGAHSDTIRRR